VDRRETRGENKQFFSSELSLVGGGSKHSRRPPPCSLAGYVPVSNIISSDALILLASQLQTQQVMTSQIRSHIECLIQTYYILVLIL